MVSLRPVTADELPAFLAVHADRYAEDMVDNAGLTPEAARAKADRDLALVEDALKLAVDVDGRTVGRVVVGFDAFATRGLAFLYEIVLDEDVRGRGLGRETLRAVEEEARAHGMARIQLNVFGGNTVARSLYRSEGYDELSVSMGKAL